MKISIITATFNSKHFIAEAIKSVHSQKYHDIEHIIIDGQSTDGTIDIIRQHETEFTRFVSEPDFGIYDALNKGIRMATGDIIGILHSDDVFNSPETLSHVMQEFSDHAVDAVYGDLVYVSRQTDKITRYWKSGEFNLRKLKFGWMPPHPSFYVRKDVYRQYGFFDTSYRISADYDLMMRFLKQGISVSYLPEVMVRMRQGGTSNKSLKNLLIKSCEDWRVMNTNKIGGLFTIVCKNCSKIPQFLHGAS